MIFVGLTKLLVANGGEDYLKSVEIINLDQENPNLICDNLQDFPLGLRGTTGQLFTKSKPIICGGYQSDKNETCKCFAYANDNWNSIASLNDCRRFSVSALITKENSEDFLFIAGGAYDISALATVESFDGNNWSDEMFADMPITSWLHCIVKINDSVLFVAGGVEGYYVVIRKTYFFNIEDNRWFPGKINNNIL